MSVDPNFSYNQAPTQADVNEFTNLCAENLQSAIQIFNRLLHNPVGNQQTLHQYLPILSTATLNHSSSWIAGEMHLADHFLESQSSNPDIQKIKNDYLQTLIQIHTNIHQNIVKKQSQQGLLHNPCMTLEVEKVENLYEWIRSLCWQPNPDLRLTAALTAEAAKIKASLETEEAVRGPIEDSEAMKELEDRIFLKVLNDFTKQGL